MQPDIQFSSNNATTELAHIKKFLEDSEDFKKMQAVAAIIKPHEIYNDELQRPAEQVLVENIKNCKTFSEILDLTKFRKDAPPMAVNIAITFGVGFFDQSANFTYYEIFFRKNLQEKMKDLGYKLPAEQPNAPSPAPIPKK